MLNTVHARIDIIPLNSVYIIRKLHKLLQISLRSILFHKAANVSRTLLHKRQQWQKNYTLNHTLIIKHFYRSPEQLMNNISIKQLPLKNTVQAPQRQNK